MNLLSIRNGNLPYVVQDERYGSSGVSVLISFARVSIVSANSTFLQSYRQRKMPARFFLHGDHLAKVVLSGTPLLRIVQYDRTFLIPVQYDRTFRAIRKSIECFHQCNLNGTLFWVYNKKRYCSVTFVLTNRMRSPNKD